MPVRFTPLRLALSENLQWLLEDARRVGIIVGTARAVLSVVRTRARRAVGRKVATKRRARSRVGVRACQR